MRTVRLAVMLLCLIAVFATAQERGLQPQDYYQQISVGSLAVSPDGSAVAFVRTEIVEEKNSRHSEIWLLQLEHGLPAGEAVRLTSPLHEAGSPRWSPDGSLLSFTSQRDGGAGNIWFLRMAAPGGEAFQIPGVEGTPVWSPDGRQIAFLKVPEPEEERGERYGWIAPDALSTTLDPERFDGHLITDFIYKQNGNPGLLPHHTTRGDAQLFHVAAEGGEARQLTDLPYAVSSVVWAPDGSHLFFTADPDEDNQVAALGKSTVYRLPVGGGEPVAVTPVENSETAVAVSREGDKIIYLQQNSAIEQIDLMLMNLFDGTVVNLTEHWDYSPQNPVWRSDSEAVRFSAFFHGNSHLFEVSAAGGEVQQLTSGDRWLGGFSWSTDGQVLACTVSTPLTPGDLWVGSGNGSDMRKATSFNDAWLAEISLNAPERITWKAPDGLEIEGWVVKPVDFDPEERYPLVMKIHGGPHWLYGNYWFTTFHVLSASGMFVFYPNPRGSGSYDHAFTYSQIGGWGVADEHDYLSGIDAVLEAYPQIDSERIGVAGGSYGGYMTNWLTARHDRFAAAVASRTVTRMENLWGTSDLAGWIEVEMGGTPWELPELYRQLSPFTWVEGVQAPTLLIHSEWDWRTPMGDAELWYAALKRRGIPTELARYPRSNHNLSRTGEPWLLVDREERLRSWLVHWLIDAALETSENNQ